MHSIAHSSDSGTSNPNCSEFAIQYLEQEGYRLIDSGMKMASLRVVMP